MRLVEDAALVPATLARWGERFVCLRHLSKTYLDGAAFWLAEGPVVSVDAALRSYRRVLVHADARTGPPGRGPQRGVPGSVGGRRRGRARTVARRLLRGGRKSPGERVVAGAGDVQRFRCSNRPALLACQHRGVCCQPESPPRHRARPLAARRGLCPIAICAGCWSRLITGVDADSRVAEMAGGIRKRHYSSDVSSRPSNGIPGTVKCLFNSPTWTTVSDQETMTAE